VLGVKPVKVWEWEVVKVVLRGVNCPYEVVNPYSTCVVEGSLVVQVMVAPDEVMEEALTAEITGGVVSEACELLTAYN
jgi:hypothetical protein